MSRLLPGARELLHSRGKLRRLANGCIVHVQITADGALDDITREGQLPTTLKAELGVAAVLVLAPRTLHAGPPSELGRERSDGGESLVWRAGGVKDGQEASGLSCEDIGRKTALIFQAAEPARPQIVCLLFTRI